MFSCLTLAAALQRPPLSVTGLTDPNRTAAPAPLWYRHPVAGAGLAEPLAARSAVMLPLCLLEQLLTAVAGLRGAEPVILGRAAEPQLQLSTHCDLGVGSPVGWGHLVGEPSGDSLGGAGAVLRHRLDHKVHPIQDPLSRVLVGGQEGVGLKGRSRRSVCRSGFRKQ